MNTFQRSTTKDNGRMGSNKAKAPCILLKDRSLKKAFGRMESI